VSGYGRDAAQRCVIQQRAGRVVEVGQRDQVGVGPDQRFQRGEVGLAAGNIAGKGGNARAPAGQHCPERLVHRRFDQGMPAWLHQRQRRQHEGH